MIVMYFTCKKLKTNLAYLLCKKKPAIFFYVLPTSVVILWLLCCSWYRERGFVLVHYSWDFSNKTLWLWLYLDCCNSPVLVSLWSFVTHFSFLSLLLHMQLWISCSVHCIVVFYNFCYITYIFSKQDEFPPLPPPPPPSLLNGIR
jgi:hypothetical protein